jgi:hypothetical protein
MDEVVEVSEGSESLKFGVWVVTKCELPHGPP